MSVSSRASSFDETSRLQVHSLGVAGRSTASSVNTAQRRFKSSLLKVPNEKPWLDRKRDRREKWAVWIPIVGIVCGFVALIGLAVSGWFKVAHDDYCLVFEDEFDGSTIDSTKWEHEVQLNGFGNGEFDWTTSDPRNSYIKDKTLHIVPTLTNQSGLTDTQIYNGYTVNLTTNGECTNTDDSFCSLTSNITTGAIIPPIQSARLSTKGKHTITFGRVEVKAKLPVGDWLWPAIWMLPQNDTFGVWPKSGEMDIMESRGNARSYWPGGNNKVESTLHWGPTEGLDRGDITTRGQVQPLGDFTTGFHTYGMEWTENHFYTYIDTPLRQIFYYEFPKSLWNAGNFPASDGLDPLYDIWHNKTAPFNQAFYLILNVAVGGTNGYFNDGVANKPWSNGDTVAAKYHFYQNINSWWPSWSSGKTDEHRGMAVKSVKMWQKGTCHAAGKSGKDKRMVVKR